VVLSGAVLLAGLWLAPRLSPRLILPASVLWYLALALLVSAGVRIVRSWTGPRIAWALALLLLLLPVGLCAIRPGPALAVRLPCPRNYAWLPAWLPRSSPLATLEFGLGEARVKLCYGRPAARGRRMLGGSRVPYGRLWRTGANEPTTLITTDSLEIAGIRVPPGRVSLYTIPGPESWELIVNAATGQWGIESEYSEAVRARELGRSILPSDSGSLIERMRFSVEKLPEDSVSVSLVLAWETTRLRIPLRRVSR